METFKIFEEIIATTKTNIPISGFIISLLMSTVLGFVLAKVFIKYANVMSNRKMMAYNLMLLVIITTLVISIVKSSLALSLGLVGALSIVRFRTAIKEPEELIYLFIAIAIGLGMGAGQVTITLIAFVLIVIIIAIVNKTYFNVENEYNLYLTITNKNPKKIKSDIIAETLKPHCVSLVLKRLDENIDSYEILFMAAFENYKKLNDAKNALKKMDENLVISILDNQAIN
tara:strand:+ start:1082 stop:1768 length:687 start_codon:yes stop_codon:yes gene_type:complete